MKNNELKILFSVGIIWNFIAIYLTTDLGITFNINSWFMWQWPFVFFLGYFCDRIINDKNIKMVYLFGIIGFIISVLGKTYLESFQFANDISAGFIIFTMGCYLFWEKHIIINNETAKKIINFMAKHSFLTYMFHFFIVNSVTNTFITPNSGILQYFLFVIVTYIIAYAISILVSCILIKPIQKFLTHLLIRS